MKHCLLATAATCVLACGCSGPKHVSSPDGTCKVSFSTDSRGQLTYSISKDGTDIMSPSALGLKMKAFFGDGVREIDACSGLKVKSIKTDSEDFTWEQPWGENKLIRDNHREIAIELEGPAEITVRCRAFDDGVGFRYEVRVPGSDSIHVMDENTGFSFTADGTSWSIPASFETYELDYRELPVSKVENANTPFTVTYGDSIFLSIHEAALTDYPEMTLANAGGTSFKSELAHWPDGVKARFDGDSFKTPWRTVQISEKATGLINSGLILNLNEPCALESTDWIRPMKYVGIWWGMHLGINTWKMDERHGATTEETKKYIDFAAANNIQGVVIEGWNKGWEDWGVGQGFNFTEPYADFDIDEIVRYAREKGVSIIGHHETGGNVPNYEAQLDSAYRWYADKGIHAVKTGYAGGLPDGHSHHGQYNVRHYRKVVQTAAAYHTVLDVHEPIKETGIRRTYPNMMTREGAKGMEWNAWSAGNSPEHELILPFTRLLAGPMDYTPGTFDILFENTRNLPQRQKWNDQDKGNSRVNTTISKQIANWVILYSPLQMASDLVEHYEGHPAFQFFRDFDADCDWSEALDGRPGDFIAVVRKAKDRYFLGASTNSEARTINISLGFLEKGKKYMADIYADAEDSHWKTNPCAYRIMHKEVCSEDSLEIVMAPGGGQAIVFKPVN